MAINLTNLTNVKGWISSPAGSGMSSGDDATLKRLIASCSRQAMSYIGRQAIYRQNITNDTYTGNGSQSLLICQWPVISMTQVLINDVSIPAASNPNSAGWLLQPWDGFSVGRPQLLQLNGYAYQAPIGSGIPYSEGGAPWNNGFTRGSACWNTPQNVVLSYIAGYAVIGEKFTVPAAPYQYTAVQALGTWGQDDGAIYTSTGVALTAVANSPAQGQYSVADNGIYTFNSADSGSAITINYSVVPYDLEQAIIEFVGESYSYKSRIGQKSKSLNGVETASYNIVGVPDRIKTMLNPYKSVIFKRS